MMNLLWKDYRQNRALLLAVAVIALGPYIVGLLVITISFLSEVQRQYVWLEPALHASTVSLFLCVLLAAFLGANAIAGERADRSAEFAAGLPIPRSRSAASKAAVAALPCLVIWIVGSLVFGGTVWAVSDSPYIRIEPSESAAIILGSLLGSMLLLGVGWLYSSMMKSPAIAAAAAIGTGVVLAIAGLTLLGKLPRSPLRDQVLLGLIILSLALGLLSFAAGTIIFTRQREP